MMAQKDAPHLNLVVILIMESAMIKVYRITVLLFFTLISYGCSKANIQSINIPVPGNTSTITVFRPEALLAGGNTMIVAINSNDIAKLENNQYVSVNLPAGEHTVSVRADVGQESEATIITKPSNNIYFEAAGSSHNSYNFIPFTVFFKPFFYIENANSFDAEGFTKIDVLYN